MLPKYSVKKPLTIVVLVIAIIALGVISFTNTGVDLLPDMELPYVVVMTTYPGASPEEVETDITQHLEASLGITSGLKNITSMSQENVSMIIMEFSQDMNMDSAMVELSSMIDTATALFPDGASSPIMMRINPSMLPVMIMTADKDGATDADFSDYVNETLLPAFSRIDGVATTEAIGLISEQIELVWKDAVIEEYNQLILEEIDSGLAKAQRELNTAQSELNKAKSDLEEQTDDLYGEMAEASNQISEGRLLMQLGQNELDAAPEQLAATRTELLSSRDSLKMLLDMYDTIDTIDEALDSMQDTIAALEAAEYALIMEFGSTDAAVRALQEQQTALDIAYATYQITGDAVSSGLTQELANSAALLSRILAILPDSDISIPPITDPEQGYLLMRVVLGQAVTVINDLSGSISETEAVYDELSTQWDTIMGLLGNMSRKDIKDAIAQIDEGVAEIDRALAEDIPQAQIELQEKRDELDEGALELEKGKLQLSTELSSASVQLALGQAQLDQAREEFEKARDEAFKNAGLDGALTPAMLSSIIGAENFSMPAGYISDGENDDILLKVGDKFLDVEELADLTIMDIDINGIGEIKVSDICDITISDNSGEYYAIVNGNPGVIIYMQKQSLYSTADVAERINDVMDELMAADSGLHLTPLSDQGNYINVAISSVLSNLLIGAILAILILLLFLRDIRPTLIVGLAIPISLLFALTLMYFSGVSINVISLAGLAMGVGMLVDNSIVVIENVYRLRALGKPPAEAAVYGAKQVTAAITASTLTTICVFLPVVFTQGLTRQLFADMGLTVAYSLLASLMIALTVIPAAASNILRKEARPSKIYEKFVNFYTNTLIKNLKHKWVVISFCLLVMVAAVTAISSMGTIFMPAVDYGEISLTVQAKEDETATEQEIKDYSSEAMDRILEMDGIATVAAYEGMLGMSSGDEAYSVSMYVILDPKAGISSTEAAAELRKLTADIPADFVISSSATTSMSMLSSSGITITIKGDDGDMLATIAEDLAAIMAGVEGLTEIDDGLAANKAELRVIVDKNKAMQYNLTVAQVYQKLAMEVNSSNEIMQMTIDGKKVPVIVSSDPNSSLTRATLANFSFEVEVANISDGTSEKKTVYLSDIATIVEAEGFSTIYHTNQSRTHSVSAQVDDEHNIGLVSRDLEAAVAKYEVPSGYSLEFGGENEQISSMLDDVILMILLAIGLIYLIMVAQFQSLLSPFIILFTIPLAFSGGLVALLIAGMEISIVAMLGFLLLAGIIVNNGIVLIDRVNQLRDEGMAKHDALVEAGRQRLRPILMTALTTICSLLGMVFSQQMGAELLRPMAIVAAGGLLYATVLTLFLVPALYDIFNRRERRVVVISEEEE